MIILRLLPFFFILSASCASQPVISKVFFEDEDRLIRLDVVYRTGGQEHNHPVELSKTELANALRSISVRPQRGLVSFLLGQKGFQFPPAFPEEMVQFLASQGAVALHNGTPLEEVVFYFNLPREDSIIREITSGSFYVQGGRIHFVVANYRHGIAGSMEADRAREDPLTILGEPLYVVIPGPNGQVEKTMGWTSSFTDVRQHISIDLYAKANLVQDSTKEKEGSQDAQVSEDMTTVEKLRELDTMRQERLITEKEFEQKRRQLLDSF